MEHGYIMPDNFCHAFQKIYATEFASLSCHLYTWTFTAKSDVGYFSESTSSTRVAVLYMTLNKAKSLLPVIEPVSIDANKTFIVSLDITSGSFFAGRNLFTDVILHPYFMNATFFLAKKL